MASDQADRQNGQAGHDVGADKHWQGRAAPVTRQAEHDPAERATQVEHYCRKYRGVDRQACLLQQRRQPGDQDKGHQQAGEEGGPEEQGGQRQIRREQAPDTEAAQAGLGLDVALRFAAVAAGGDAVENGEDARLGSANRHQMADRLRQPQDQHRDQRQGGQASGDEDTGPAVDGNDPGGKGASEHRSQGEAGKHHCDEGRPQSTRGIFRRQRDQVRGDAAQTDAPDEAHGQQDLSIGGPGRGESDEAEQQGPGDDEPFAAEAIGERAEQELPHHDPEKASRENHPKARGRDAPVMGDHGRDERDRLGVEPVDHRRQAADQ